MENNEVVDVRVVETVSNYTEAMKLAVVAGVVGVLATTVTTYAMNKLSDRMKQRRLKKNTEVTNLT